MKELEPSSKGPGKGDRNRSASPAYRRNFDEIDWHRERAANGWAQPMKIIRTDETKSKPVCRG